MPEKKVQRKHKTDTQWFLTNLERRDLTQKDAARALGIDQASANHLFHGKRAIKLNEAIKLAALLEVTIDEILSHAGMPVDLAKPKEGAVSVKGWVDGDFTIHEGTPAGAKTAPAPNPHPRGTIALRFVTAGSKLDVMDGGLVYYVPSKTVDQSCLGRISVCKITTGETKLCVLRRGYRPGGYNLYTLAGELMREDAQLESSACVNWIFYNP